MIRRLAPVVVLLAACGGGDDGPEVVGTTIAGAREITLVATDFSFAPAAFEITAGEPVNIILQVDDGSHNLVVADTDFAIPERDGGAAVATLVLDEPGSYTFGCTVLGHVSEGMVGAITVT